MKLLSSYFLIVETIGLPPLKKHFATIFNLGSQCLFFLLLLTICNLMHYSVLHVF